MQRYTLTEYSDAEPDTRAVFDDFMRTTGATEVPVWLKSLGHTPALTRAYWEKAKGVLFGGSLPLPLKEMVVFAVSAQNGAKYCTACHAQNVLSLDTSLQFKDLQSFIQKDRPFELPAVYAGVVQFALSVAKNPNAVADADFEELLADGFSLAEICEIIAVVDMSTMFNIYTSSLRLDLDANYCAIL